MTKEELQRRIVEEERMLEAILPLSDGQECLIYKAQEFSVGDEIIYIPDVWENNLDILNGHDDDDGISYAQRVVENCYTGKDFVELCDGDVELAERLFHYCDWQHPSSALPEVDDEDERMERAVKSIMDQNMNKYQAELLRLEKPELIAKSAEITAMREAYDFMKNDFNFECGDAETLLRMENPLRFVAEHCMFGVLGLFNMNDHVRDAIEEAARAAAPHRVDGPLAQKKATVHVQAGKPSILEQLRHVVQEIGQHSPSKKPTNRDVR